MSLPAGSTELDFLLIINSWQFQAESYKRLGDEAMGKSSTGASPVSQGTYLLPVAFLYRHYLELMLKNLVRGGLTLHMVKAIDDSLAGHNLHRLWNSTKVLLDHICDESDRPGMRFAESLVLQYHAIDESGCAFRYPCRNNGTEYLDSLPTHGNLANQLRNVDLAGMRRDIEKAHQFFVRASELLNGHIEGHVS